MRRHGKTKKKPRPRELRPIDSPAALNRAGDLVVMALCFVVPLYLSNRLTTLHTIEDSKWLAVVWLSFTACVLLLLSRALGGRGPERCPSVLQRPLGIGGIVYASVHLAAAAVSAQPGNSLRAAMGPVSLILVFAMLVWTVPPAQRIYRYLGALVGTAAIVGAVALLQHAGADPVATVFRFAETDRYRTGVYATLGNPEYLGGYLAPLALVAIGMTVGARHRWARGAAAVPIALTAIPALLTGSRGAFLGLVGGLGLFAVTSVLMGFRSNRRRLAAVSAASIVALMAVLVLFTWKSQTGPFRLLRERLAAVADPYEDNIRNRIVFYVVAADVAMDRPVLGAGPGMFGPAFYPTLLKRLRETSENTAEIVARDLRGGVPERVHNDWLEIWVGTGMVGLGAWFWLLAVWAVLVFQRILLADQGRDQWVLAGVAAAVAAVLANALFNFPLHEPARATVFWILLGAGGALSLRQESAQYDPGHRR